MKTPKADTYFNAAASLGDRWAARRMMPRFAMESWNMQQWAQWWKDGVEIYLSDYPGRETAFAPAALKPGAVHDGVRYLQTIPTLIRDLVSLRLSDTARERLEQGVISSAADMARYPDTAMIFKSVLDSGVLCRADGLDAAAKSPAPNP